MRLHALSDRSLIRAGARSTRYVKVSFTAPEAPRTGERRPLNVSLVLDRSGSMAGEKIALARRAARQALDLLRNDDRFSVVVYDDRVDLLAESSHATAEARRRAQRDLDGVEARNSTDLCGGWLRGCEQVGLDLTDQTLGRCLLLTDGLANRGITDHAEILRHAAELRARGVATSTFGVGADFDERLLRGMAERGGGHFYFIEQAGQIPDFLAGEMGEALEVVARGVTLLVELPAGASVEPLGAFEARRTEQGAAVDLGDVVSGQEVELVLAITFDRGTEGRSVEAGFSITDRDAALDSTEERLVWTYASHPENDRQPRDRTVDRAVAQAYAARARAEATERNREHDFEGARRVLRRTAARIREYAGDDPELLRIAAELEAECERYAERPMTAMELKQAHFAAYSALSARAADGRAKRAPRR